MQQREERQESDRSTKGYALSCMGITNETSLFLSCFPREMGKHFLALPLHTKALAWEEEFVFDCSHSDNAFVVVGQDHRDHGNGILAKYPVGASLIGRQV